MSAYQVSDYHINVLITWAAHNFKRGKISYYWQGKHRYITDEAKRCASVLFAQNVRSVNYRYNDSEPAHGFIYRTEHARITPVQIIKACHCLEYQSCETPDWQDTEAHAIIKAIIAAAVRQLDGYDEADWSLDKPSKSIAA